MHRAGSIIFLSTALAVLSGSGCGSGSSSDPVDGGAPDGAAAPDARTFQPTGEHYKYVLDVVVLPEGSGEAVGLDIDNAADGAVDNKLGDIVTTLSSVLDTDLQAQLTAQVDDGGVIVLADLQAASLEAAEDVGFWIIRGSDPSPAPCASGSDTECRRHLDGSGQFSADTGSPADSLIGGSISGGVFTGKERGTFSIDVPVLVGKPPVTLEAIAARAVVTVGEDGLMEGRLGGAITEREIQNGLMPQLRDLMNDQIDEDCGGAAPDCCTPDSSGDQLVDLFDADASCDLSLEEIQNSSLINGILAPDVDLLNAEGFHVPNQDGVVDSVSLGVGFTAVPADFEMPSGY